MLSAQKNAQHGLSRDERSQRTDALLRQAHSTDDTLERAALLDDVVVLNVRVAHAVAGRYRGRGVAAEDLEQAACEGLVKAVQRFDPSLHHDLLSYAVPTIRGEVQRYFRDLSWQVRPPRRLQELQWRINQGVAELSLDLGRDPTPAEICTAMEIERADYDEAMQAFGCFQPPSLDQEVGAGEHLSVGDSIADDRDTDGPVEARTMLAPVLRRLGARERRILHLRFVEDQTQREIGDELGVAQMQVSRWLSQIFAQMREEIGEADVSSPAGSPDGGVVREPHEVQHVVRG